MDSPRSVSTNDASWREHSVNFVFRILSRWKEERSSTHFSNETEKRKLSQFPNPIPMSLQSRNRTSRSAAFVTMTLLILQFTNSHSENFTLERFAPTKLHWENTHDSYSCPRVSFAKSIFSNVVFSNAFIYFFIFPPSHTKGKAVTARAIGYQCCERFHPATTPARPPSVPRIPRTNTCFIGFLGASWAVTYPPKIV